MTEIFKREIGTFFNSLTGYVVIVVYLSVNSLFMWLLPGDWNILDSGYAGIDTLFIISPWVFLFLVPAVTMRTLAEEKRSGTLELLLTHPVTEREIIAGKYFASVVLVLLALLPGLIYYLSVWLLGDPPGNLDVGGTWGAYIGLFFLGSVYAACGILASSLTDNQVVAFIIAVLISLFMYIGFESVSYLPGASSIETLLSSLGINEHYKSLSRGVIDLRDISYFIVVIIIFLEAARLKMVSEKWNRKYKA